MTSPKKVLVGIMRAGENEFPACIDALKQQTHQNFDYFVIENQPNKLAHDLLYASFMRHADQFDLFLKLDADMVFATNDALEGMVRCFDPTDIAHLFAYVLDIPSSIKIPGIQMFRSDTVWLGSDDQLNVDYPPKLHGASYHMIDCNWINHMPDPSNYQLFRYGIHKALKSIQSDRDNKSIQKGILHASILNGIARNAIFYGRENLHWSLIGAMLLYGNQLNGINYNSPETETLFRQIEKSERLYATLRQEAQNYWLNEIQSLFRWLKLFQKA